MDVSQYLEIFLDETNEHLQNLNTQILELESDPENMDNINEIFRAAHSLKGMAGTMGYKRMQNLTHDMENVFSEVRNGNIKVTPEMIDVLFQCLDALDEYKNNIQETSDEGTNDNENLIKALNDILNGSKAGQAQPEKKEKAKPIYRFLLKLPHQSMILFTVPNMILHLLSGFLLPSALLPHGPATFSDKADSSEAALPGFPPLLYSHFLKQQFCLHL